MVAHSGKTQFFVRKFTLKKSDFVTFGDLKFLVSFYEVKKIASKA